MQGQPLGRVQFHRQARRHVKGPVKSITDFGVFVGLSAGIDGLLHITDMAWRRVRHPSEVVTVGQELTAKALKFDAEKNRVSLGIKQLGDDPWHGVSRRYPQSTRLFGKVTNIADYGAFVEIEPGRKARMPLTSTVRPPLTLPLTVPTTNSPESSEFSSDSHEARRLALSRDRMVSP